MALLVGSLACFAVGLIAGSVAVAIMNRYGVGGER